MKRGRLYEQGSDAEVSSDQVSDDYEDSGSDEPRCEEAGPSHSRRDAESRGYRVIDSELLKKLQREVIDSVVSIWGCRPSVAKTLLMHHMWDKEKLLSELADRGPEVVYKAAGVVEDDDAARTAPSSGGTINCSVCMCDCPVASCSTNGCGHTFCNDCWLSHLGVQIGDGKARHITCMAFKCGVVADEELVERVMAGHQHLLSRYQQSHLESYMEDNKRVAFCPSAPWCGHAIEVDCDPYVEPECGCGVVFCFKCQRAPHSPCTCEMWGMWDEKVSGDSESRNWMMANTKPCPKCSKPVEKNGGCNLLVCKCGQPFCWLCGQSTGMAHTWTSIEGHQCGRWKDESDARQSEALRNHKRYMHYFERFKLHDDSHEKEKRNRSKLLARIRENEHDGVEARDFSWLIQSLDQLKVARRVLSNSYAFAYFFFGGQLYADDFTPEQNRINQDLFEDNQAMLASEVERLSGLVDSASDTLSLDAELRLNVINSSVNIHQRIIKFFDLIENDLYGRLTSSNAQIAMHGAGLAPRK